MAFGCDPRIIAKPRPDVEYHRRNDFRPLLLLRRYLELCVQLAADSDLLGLPLDHAGELPFAVDVIPTKFPAPVGLCLTVTDPGAG